MLSDSTPTIDTELDIPLYEKVEALFNLRISSSGSDIGVLFDGKKEAERVWMDYEVFSNLRKSIETLIESETARAREEQSALTSDWIEKHIKMLKPQMLNESARTAFIYAEDQARQGRIAALTKPDERKQHDT